MKDLRRSHFTNEGVVEQMRRLFVDPETTDFVCQPLPYWSGADLWPPGQASPASVVLWCAP